MKSKNQLQVHPDDDDVEGGHVEAEGDDEDDDDIDSVDDKKIKKEIKRKKKIKTENKKRKQSAINNSINNDDDDKDSCDVSSGRSTKKSKTQIDLPLATLLDLNPNENRFKVSSVVDIYIVYFPIIHMMMMIY